MYLTPQNTFLEDLRNQKLVIFLPPGNHGVAKEKLPYQKTVPQKISGYSPATIQIYFTLHIYYNYLPLLTAINNYYYIY